MMQKFSAACKAYWRAAGMLGAVAACILFIGQDDLSRSHTFGRNQPGGKLIAVEPLPSIDGEMCEWVPASTMALLQGQTSATQPGDSSRAAGLPTAAQQEEVRKR